MINYVAIGSIIIDDIVDPLGRSNMGVLGGGGSHAVAGMRVWSQKTALVSIIGQNFPEPAWRQLTRLADSSGIARRAVPQPRFWQLFESDGTRNEVARTNFDQFQKISIRPDEFPVAFSTARGVFLQARTAAEAIAWATHLKSLKPDIVLLWEPWEIFYKVENLPDFRRAAPLFDIISPQTLELSRMLQETDPERQVSMLFDSGVRGLALRLGAAGSLVGADGVYHPIPAFPVSVIDETGAGNAYCGGFVVGYVESGGDLLQAARYGAVSATFALAQVGVPQLKPEVRDAAEKMLRQISIGSDRLTPPPPSE